MGGETNARGADESVSNFVWHTFLSYGGTFSWMILFGRALTGTTTQQRRSTRHSPPSALSMQMDSTRSIGGREAGSLRPSPAFESAVGAIRLQPPMIMIRRKALPWANLSPRPSVQIQHIPSQSSLPTSCGCRCAPRRWARNPSSRPENPAAAGSRPSSHRETAGPRRGCGGRSPCPSTAPSSSRDR